MLHQSIYCFYVVFFVNSTSEELTTLVRVVEMWETAALSVEETLVATRYVDQTSPKVAFVSL